MSEDERSEELPKEDAAELVASPEEIAEAAPASTEVILHHEKHMSEEARKAKGIVAWMTKNSIAANLFMFVLLFGGVLGIMRTKQEILPEFDVDVIDERLVHIGIFPVANIVCALTAGACTACRSGD